MARLKVELTVTTGGTATNAAKQATKTIPIVFMQVGNPDQQGFVASLSRPGGNITGLSNVAEEVSGKRLELLKETLPKLSRAAVLWDMGTGTHSLKATEEAARLLGVQLQPLEVREIKDFDRAFRAANQGERKRSRSCRPASFILTGEPSSSWRQRTDYPRFAITKTMWKPEG